MHRVSDENRHKRRDTKNMDIDTAKIRFKNYLESSGYAASTIECYSVYLGYFLDYLRKIKVMDLKQVTHETIRTYQLLVADMAIAEETKGMRLRPVKRLFGWLLDTHRLLLDPTEKIREAAGITKTASPHSFRRSCATHLLQQGADIRYVQKLLGHRHIRTTQIYTRVYPIDLKETHTRTHPPC
jgi:site-specific recombinase XerD